jgi:glycosyltransferase involved in cell wall biosynthesis
MGHLFNIGRGRDERVRVMLLLSHLHGGGAERVAVHLLNRCDPGLVDIRMGLLRKAGPFLSEADQSRIDVSPMGEGWLEFEGHNSSFYRPHKVVVGGVLAPLNVRRMVRNFRPHVVVSFLKGMSLVTDIALNTMGKNRPRWIAREGNNTFAVIDDELRSAFFRGIMRRMITHAYHSADCFLANSHHMAEGLRKDLRLDPGKIRVIHNPIDLAKIEALALEPIPRPADKPFIVTVGRLEFQKAQDLLLKAFAASTAAKDIDLVIIGRGSREAELKQLAADLGITNRVSFAGFQENPWAWISKARLFVLPSRWEGFPSVVAEALACGAPALVTDCAFGPREVVEHGVSGWIVPPEDEASFRAAMDLLLTDRNLSARLAQNGPVRAKQFGIDEMISNYTALFLEQALAAEHSAASKQP